MTGRGWAVVGEHGPELDRPGEDRTTGDPQPSPPIAPRPLPAPARTLSCRVDLATQTAVNNLAARARVNRSDMLKALLTEAIQNRGVVGAALERVRASNDTNR